MLRTFHLTSSADNSTINVAECESNTEVIVSIQKADETLEITLTYPEFAELCNLRYTVSLQEAAIIPLRLQAA